MGTGSAFGLEIYLNLGVFDPNREGGNRIACRWAQRSPRPDTKFSTMSWTHDALSMDDKLGFDAAAEHPRAIMATGILNGKILSLQIKHRNGEIVDINEMGLSWAKLINC